MNFIKSLFFNLFLFSTVSIYAQTNNTYIWFDNFVGKENTALYNGIEFISSFNVINEMHRFYETSNFMTGDLSYDGQEYYNVPLRYDIYGDQLIIKLESSSSTNEIMLLKDKVDRFRIGNNYFEKIEATTLDKGQLSGFYQLLTFNENFSLYKKNQKKVNRKIRDRNIYHEFSETNPEYVIKTADGFFKLSRMRDLTSRYPNYRNELNDFKLTSNDFRANDRVLILVINRLNQLISN